VGTHPGLNTGYRKKKLHSDTIYGLGVQGKNFWGVGVMCTTTRGEGKSSSASYYTEGGGPEQRGCNKKSMERKGYFAGGDLLREIKKKTTEE